MCCGCRIRLLAGAVCGGVKKFLRLSSNLHGRRRVLNHRVGVRCSLKKVFLVSFSYLRSYTKRSSAGRWQRIWWIICEGASPPAIGHLAWDMHLFLGEPDQGERDVRKIVKKRLAQAEAS